MAKSFFSKEQIEEKIKDTVDYEWMEGYKGTDRNMMCRDYQYELGVQHDMDEDAEISLCSRGFHLCKELDDVFNFYSIGKGNRFFKVKALVKKVPIEEKTRLRNRGGRIACDPDKYVARSIIFERELTKEEILAGTEAEHWTEEYQTAALEFGIGTAKRRMQIDRLIELGYSAPLALLLSDRDLGDIAEAVGQREGLSMDMKIFTIFELSGITRTANRDDIRALINKSFVMPSTAGLARGLMGG